MGRSTKTVSWRLKPTSSKGANTHRADAVEVGQTVKVCATELDTGKAAVEGQQRKVLRQ
jgi:hypothetical protein